PLRKGQETVALRPRIALVGDGKIRTDGRRRHVGDARFFHADNRCGDGDTADRHERANRNQYLAEKAHAATRSLRHGDQPTRIPNAPRPRSGTLERILTAADTSRTPSMKMLRSR